MAGMSLAFLFLPNLHIFATSNALNAVLLTDINQSPIKWTQTHFTKF